LLISVSIAAALFGRDAARGRVVEQLQDYVGRDAARSIESIIGSGGSQGASATATVIGAVVLLLGASGVFRELQDSFNVIWNVPPRPPQTVVAWITTRLISFAMVAFTGLLLLASMLISAGLAALKGSAAGASIGISATLLETMHSIVSFAVTTILFAAIFKRVPDVRIAWADVWRGASVTALLFTIGKVLIGLYLGRSGIASAYGAAGSVVILMVWIYYSAQILFFGAEFTQVYANRYGSRLLFSEPDEAGNAPTDGQHSPGS
jgi:membrane protein